MYAIPEGIPLGVFPHAHQNNSLIGAHQGCLWPGVYTTRVTRMSDAYSECVKGSLKLKGVSSGGVKKY